MPVTGIITVGTPHGGAPIAAHETAIREMGVFASVAAFTVAQAYLTKQDLMPYEEYIYWDLRSDIRYALAGLAATGTAALTVFTQQTIDKFLNGQPALADLNDTNAFLTALNSPANLAREAAVVPARIGIVSDAGQYDPWVGPFALLTESPVEAYSLMTNVTVPGWYLFDYGYLLLVEANPQTPWWSADVAGAIAAIQLGQSLVDLPYTYCNWVGGCVDGMGDFIVPFSRQLYPGADLNQVIYYGPTHGRETRDPLVWDEVRFHVGSILGM